MKNTIFISILCAVFSVSLYAQQNNKDYYYYQGEKTFLQQSANRIFLKFAQNTNKEQVLSLINSNSSLQLVSNKSIDRDYFDFVVLETKNGDDISSAVVKSLKASPIIISATPLFLYNEFVQGLADEFVVKLKPTTSYIQLQKLVEKNNCFIEEETQFVKNQFLISVSKNSNLNALEMSRLFYETNLFEFSEPNFMLFNAFYSNDTYFDEQWALENTGQSGPNNVNGIPGIDIKAEQAWTIALGTGIKVAVIDAGVDLTHPDLEDNILLPGYEHPSSGNNNGAAVISQDIHGTPCAGIIGAIKDNNKGTVGVAPNCSIKPARISTGGGYEYMLNIYWASTAIDWAWQSGADVISCSWGGGSNNQSVTDAINRATTQGRGNKGCVVVVASGNENSSTVNFPARLPNVIAVGAVDRCGVRSGRIDIVPNSCDPWNTGSYPGSTYGTALSVVAPGTNIYTTDRQDSLGYNTASGTIGDYYCCFGGTSAACPHVAGVAALILSVKPNFTWLQVRDIIEKTAQKVNVYDSISNPTGYVYTNNTVVHPNGTWSDEIGYGLVDAYTAVHCLVPLNFTQTVTTNTNVTHCSDIYAQNVIIDGATLTLETVGSINIQNVTVKNNGKLILDAGGEVTLQNVNTDNSIITLNAGSDVTIDYATFTNNSELTLQAVGNVTFQNATINSSTLTLEAQGNIDVQSVTVENNSTLILDAGGEVNIISDFDVQLGSELDIKKH